MRFYKSSVAFNLHHASSPQSTVCKSGPSECSKPLRESKDYKFEEGGQCDVANSLDFAARSQSPTGKHAYVQNIVGVGCGQAGLRLSTGTGRRAK